jgi:uncharacterized protein YjbI with pentapeptide repeats
LGSSRSSLKSSNGAAPVAKYSITCSPIGAKLKGARLAATNFTRSDLQNTVFSGADLHGATLYAALLGGANFTDADLTRARIVGGGRGMKFSKAKLVDADPGADPANQGVVLVRAELPEASFDGADLARANLIYAVLTSANFSGAIVRAPVSIMRCSTASISLTR